MWLATAGFSAGIAVGDAIGLGPVIAVSAAALIALALRSLRLRLAGMIAFAFVVGALITSLHAQRALPITELARRYPRCRLEGRISQRSGLGTFVRVGSLRCSGRLYAGGEVLVNASAELGSRVIAEGWLVPLRPTGFDAIRARAGAAADFRAARVRVGDPRGLYRPAMLVRRSLRRATAERRPVTAGLLRGLAIGETELIPVGEREVLRRAGLSHLVAVSGTNVTIVLTAVAAVAARVSRRARLGACGAALGCFVAIVGPEPSVLRAATMGAIGLVAVLAGTRTQPLVVLAVATTCVVAARPPMVHAVGLHLSVAATAGICVWAAAIEQRIRIGPRWLRAAAAVTLAAQVAVAPLLVRTFGEISVVGVPANVVAAPAVAPATVLALVAAVVGLVWPSGAAAVIAMAAPFAEWIAFVGRLFGTSELAAVAVPRWIAWPCAAFAVAALISRWFADPARHRDPAWIPIADRAR